MALRCFVEEESKAERLSPVSRVGQLASSTAGMGPSLWLWSVWFRLLYNFHHRLRSISSHSTCSYLIRMIHFLSEVTSLFK